MTFPVVSYRDSVRVHKALVDSLGVKKMRAVAGASGGSIQAMEWAALYPDFVERVVHVIGPGFDISPYVVEMLDVWTLPIKLDPKWSNGDYYGKEEPVAGVAQALKIVTITARAHGWAEKTFGFKWADPAKTVRVTFPVAETGFDPQATQDYYSSHVERANRFALAV